MSKILIVPDVHGRAFWHKAMEMIDQVDHIVFLGDYLDPYEHEGIDFDLALEEFKKILAFKEEYPDDVTLLLGNHDCHYLIQEFMECSRLNYRKRDEIHKLYQQNINKFNLVYLYQDKWLFSHAGVYENWLEHNDLTLEKLQNFKEFITNYWITLEDLSYYRGGYKLTGSCIWADVRESLKHNLLPNVRHIVGHTQLESKPYISDKITCLDVRRCFILDTETDTIHDA